jgi:hypothetical protein
LPDIRFLLVFVPHPSVCSIVDFIKKERPCDYLAGADESSEPNPFAQPYRRQAACACALQ